MFIKKYKKFVDGTVTTIYFGWINCLHVFLHVEYLLKFDTFENGNGGISYYQLQQIVQGLLK